MADRSFDAPFGFAQDDNGGGGRSQAAAPFCDFITERQGFLLYTVVTKAQKEDRK